MSRFQPVKLQPISEGGSKDSGVGSDGGGSEEMAGNLTEMWLFSGDCLLHTG